MLSRMHRQKAQRKTAAVCGAVQGVHGVRYGRGGAGTRGRQGVQGHEDPREDGEQQPRARRECEDRGACFCPVPPAGYPQNRSLWPAQGHTPKTRQDKNTPTPKDRSHGPHTRQEHTHTQRSQSWATPPQSNAGRPGRVLRGRGSSPTRSGAGVVLGKATRRAMSGSLRTVGRGGAGGGVARQGATRRAMSGSLRTVGRGGAGGGVARQGATRRAMSGSLRSAVCACALPCHHARQTVGIRMTLSATARQVWQCGEHTVKLRNRRCNDSLLPNMCFSFFLFCGTWQGQATPCALEPALAARTQSRANLVPERAHGTEKAEALNTRPTAQRAEPRDSASFAPWNLVGRGLALTERDSHARTAREQTALCNTLVVYSHRCPPPRDAIANSPVSNPAVLLQVCPLRPLHRRWRQDRRKDGGGCCHVVNLRRPRNRESC